MSALIQNSEYLELALSTLSDSQKMALLVMIGVELMDQFERTGSMDDLDRAIMTNEQAVASTPDDHPDLRDVSTTWGLHCRARFERTGSMDDLDRAIVTNEQAVELTPGRSS